MLDVFLGMLLGFFIGVDQPTDAQGACLGSGAESAQQQVPCPPPLDSTDSTDSTDNDTGLIKVGGTGLLKIGGTG
jgi:hypothetical protein